MSGSNPALRPLIRAMDGRPDGFRSEDGGGVVPCVLARSVGAQRSKSFSTKREASRFLAEIELTKNRGLYVDPRAGRIKLGEYAKTWAAGRSSATTTTVRSDSIMRTHVLPRWGAVPLDKIDHPSVQAWVTELNTVRSAATVRKCFHALAGIMRLAVRDRLLAFNPCEACSSRRFGDPTPMTGRSAEKCSFTSSYR